MHSGNFSRSGQGMGTSWDNGKGEKRLFPRQEARCAVLYQTPASKRWLVAHLVDFAAAGLRMECDELLAPGTPIAIQLRPGSDRTIPAIQGRGEVVRCAPNSNLRYEVACKLRKIKPA